MHAFKVYHYFSYTAVLECRFSKVKSLLLSRESYHCFSKELISLWLKISEADKLKLTLEIEADDADLKVHAVRFTTILQGNSLGLNVFTALKDCE